MPTKIDIATYKRRTLFEAFKDREVPYLSTTCNVDITNLHEFLTGKDYGFFVPVSFLISHAVNLVAELRHRVIDGQLYEFSRVDPGYTVLLDDETFSFCDARHFEGFKEYRDYAGIKIQEAKKCPDRTTGEKHRMFFITNLPWFSFTSIVHPYSKQYGSIPVISIGRYFPQGNSLMLPIGLQVHHGLVDGIHVGKFYTNLTEMCTTPGAWL